MRLRKYEIRMSVSKNLYDRIAQEAKYRDTKMANIAREKLAKHYLQHERSANSLEATTLPHENQTNTSIQTQILQTEKKLSTVSYKIEKQFELIHERTNLVIAMLDQFYFDLMKLFPNIPKQLLLAATSTAHQRHAEWLETIKKILKER